MHMVAQEADKRPDARAGGGTLVGGVVHGGEQGTISGSRTTGGPLFFLLFSVVGFSLSVVLGYFGTHGLIS